MNEEDARTKQDLLFEVSSLNARLSDEIVKNEQLQNNWNELKKWLENQKETLSWMNKELLLSFKNKEIKCIEEVLNKMQELEGNNE